MKILVAGDFCPQNRVLELFDQERYQSVLGEVKSIISEADYSIVNFECPVTKGEEKPIEKIGPILKCSEHGLEAVKWAGFNGVTLANNHFFDYGNEGAKLTLETCEKYGIDTVGGGLNLQEASRILYKKIDGETLAIINCCEHEFSIANDKTAGSNPLDPIKQYYAIQEAKSKADYVLVIVHGGHEMFQLPSLRMQDTYRFFIDAGADVVVNHHQHCYSGYENYKGKPIFYGLGNFCFDKVDRKPRSWYEGYMIKIILERGHNSFDIIPYTHCNLQPSVVILKKEETQLFYSSLQKLNEIIVDKEKLIQEINSYYIKVQKYTSSVFEPINNRYISALQKRGLFPSLLSRKKIIKLYGSFFCQSHRDKIEKYLQAIYYNK